MWEKIGQTIIGLIVMGGLGLAVLLALAFVWNLEHPESPTELMRELE